MLGLRFWSLLLAGFILLPSVAEAQIYKYKKKDGTIVYTDKLSTLPKDRRAHYNRMEAKQKSEREAAERRYGKEELQRRELEKKRKDLARAEIAAAERARRRQALDEQLDLLEKRSQARAKSKSEWSDRMKKAKAEVAKLMKDFNKAQEEFKRLAMKPSFTLLPGEAQQLEEARKHVAALESKLDAAIAEVQVNIPRAARKAGVPPGWIR